MSRKIILQYMPSSGSFGIPLSDRRDGCDLSWHKCREEFSARYGPDTLEIFYCHGNTGNVADFLQKTEEILSITEMSPENELFAYEKTVVRPTNVPLIKSILPSRFWSCCLVRRSLLTILLRCSDQYDPKINNYEQAIKSNSFALETFDSIKRFLMGHTEFKGKMDNNDPKRGWYSIFKDVPRETLKKLLVRSFTSDSVDCIMLR